MCVDGPGNNKDNEMPQPQEPQRPQYHQHLNILEGCDGWVLVLVIIRQVPLRYSKMASSSKLIQKQVKTIISSMLEKDLKRTFDCFRDAVRDLIDYSSKEISYKCFEASLLIRNKKASGYGRNDQEAYANAIRNLFEVLIEEEDMMVIIKQSIKKATDPYAEESSKENQPRKSLTLKANVLSQMTIADNENKKSRSYLKTSHLDSLNISLLKSTTTNKTETELELEGAKMYIQQLEIRLKNLEEENRSLKSKINPPEVAVELKEFVGRSSFEPTRSNYLSKQKLNASIQEVSRKPEVQVPRVQKKEECKMRIPRLKLQILPNYHGKSSKSINHSFMASQEPPGK